MLVLMCIAYFQPLTRAELSSFFGKEISRDFIGHLRGAKLIASGPRSPTPGAPYTYVTTKEFLLEFGLDTLRDLPDFEGLEDAGLLSKEKLLADEIMPGFPMTWKRMQAVFAHHDLWSGTSRPVMNSMLLAGRGVHGQKC
ncbi:SMC-Scp complex subunit ScpB [Mesorhizobium australicum]|uniref:SMC-Scp complex subunit ScpB n=1 Tax=Mesorhizobium australicum TaxID=536018 RepID=UPI003EBF075A